MDSIMVISGAGDMLMDIGIWDAIVRFQSLAYILAALLFILALAGLSKQKTAQRGNVLGMIGMALALVATIVVAVAQSEQVALGTIAIILGAIAIGAPEGALCYQYCAKMAKYYGLPCRGGGSLSSGGGRTALLHNGREQFHQLILEGSVLCVHPVVEHDVKPGVPLPHGHKKSHSGVHRLA